MRRKLAIALATLIPATSALAEPLDLDLWLLGAPDPGVWEVVLPASEDANAVALANDSLKRFGMLTSELALALTSSLLTPGSTTGHSGFDIALEAAYAGTHTHTIGSTSGTITTADPADTDPVFSPRNFWPTRGLTPHELFVPALRIRKALPFSIELGARFKYVSQSAAWAGQLETKWAFYEGSRKLPDFALRLAHTRLGGVRTLHLSATDLDFIVSKRWGVLGVVSLTPYGAMRFTFMRASTDAIVFFPEAGGAADDPATTGVDESTLAARTASFPSLSASFYRTTLGLRMTAYALSLMAEVTHYGGGEFDPDGYPKYSLKGSMAGSFRLGFEF